MTIAIEVAPWPRRRSHHGSLDTSAGSSCAQPPFVLPRCERPPDTALTSPSPGHRCSIGAFAVLGDGFGCCLLAFLDAICLAAALHAIRTVLEAAVLLSAAQESGCP